ncbi:MAG: LamG domain-containing protein [Saprospiraceae bacterium]
MDIKSYFYIILPLGLIFLNFKLPPPHFDDGLVAHYTFNKCDIKDITGNNPDGVMMGDPGCHCGVEGNALFFDGINDYVEFPGIVNRHFNTTDFTVSFYFKPNKYSVFRQSLLSKRDTCNEYNMLDFQLDINGRIVKTDLYETPEKFFRDISPELPESDWVHFALVRKGIYAYTFINGELRQESRRCSGVDIGNEVVLSFSNSPCLSSGRTVRFKGGLDELRIYDHALTDEEIAQLYALHPVEMAEVDCITFIPENDLDRLESAYLCSNY